MNSKNVQVEIMFFTKFLTIFFIFFMAFSIAEQQSSPKVVVIGAGIAGLTTAYRLHQQGINVELYEARARVGGRILTVKVNDQIGELGAQSLFDGGKAENLCRLIHESDLEIESDTILIDLAYFTGEKLIPSHELFPLFDRNSLKNQLAAIRKKSNTMFEVLNALFDVNDPAFKFLSVRLAGYEGAPVENLSSYYTETLYHMILGGISAAHQDNAIKLGSIKGGNSLLPERLAKALKSRIHLNALLTSVSKSCDGTYTLHFQNGQTASADILVLAIPCSVYTDIHFEDTVIPQERLAAIQSIQYGTNAKILVPFPKAPQQRITLINDRIGAFFNANCHLLTCYYTGKSSRFSADTINHTFNHDQPMLEVGCSYSSLTPPIMAYDESFAHYCGPVGYSWPNDPYVKGSYSYIAPGQEALLTAMRKVEGETVKILFAPIDHSLYFAGEHASILQDVSGTLEAACESGERAARMIGQMPLFMPSS
jgi:monoamine oxidase